MPKRIHKLTDKELRRKHTKWFANFSKGIEEIMDLPQQNQKYLWYCVLNECLYTTESNPFLTQMYKSDGFYDVNDCEGLEDVCLIPMNRARLVEGMKSLLMSGGRKKFTDTLKTINDSADREDY
jgi:hypothetical protein